MPNSFHTYGPHRPISACANPQHAPTPAEVIAWKHGGGTLAHLKKTDQTPAINPSKDENWLFDINVFSPNFFVDVGMEWF